MHLIETRDLCYAYPHSVKALEGINFIAPRNARIAVIGSNGAGKSTLFKHFNGIFRPSSGSVLVRGEPITKQNIREVRKFVGIVFQNADDQIFSPTVEQDVAFGPTNLGLDEETIHHRVHEALRIVGIEDLAVAEGKNLQLSAQHFRRDAHFPFPLLGGSKGACLAARKDAERDGRPRPRELDHACAHAELRIVRVRAEYKYVRHQQEDTRGTHAGQGKGGRTTGL